jgi:hypothetical protein
MENQHEQQVIKNLLDIAEFMQCPERLMKMREFLLYYADWAQQGDEASQQLVDIAKHFGGLCYYVDKKFKV